MIDCIIPMEGSLQKLKKKKKLQEIKRGPLYMFSGGIQLHDLETNENCLINHTCVVQIII